MLHIGTDNGDMTLGVAQPQQDRSRRSFEKIRRASLQLLIERGGADFTLADVSAAAKVSIGSIYGRVGSKATLLQVIQDEELGRIDEEMVAAMRVAVAREASFEVSVQVVVEAVVQTLAKNASVIRAFMTLADPRGKTSGELEHSTFCNGLASVAHRHGVVVDQETIEWCHEVVYSVTSRHLRFGLTTGGQPEAVLPTGRLEEALAETVGLLLRASKYRN